MQLANGTAYATASDSGSVQRSRTVARAGPAPVLTDASIRRRREHSRQASLDMAAKEMGSNSNLNGGLSVVALAADQERRQQNVPSYMAQTISSVRHASLGSEASIPNSVRRMRIRERAGAVCDSDSDIASVASSQWSVRRRRIGPRSVKPIERPVPARSKREAGVGAVFGDKNRAASPPGLQANAVLTRRGSAKVTPARSTALAAGAAFPEDASHNAQRGILSGSTAGSVTVTVSDDDTGDLSKSGMSVSLSPVTSGNGSGNRSGRRSTHHHHQHHRKNSDGRKSSGEHGASSGDELDDKLEPVARVNQPVSFDERNGGGGGWYAAAGPSTGGKGSAEKSNTNNGGRPPLTPRGGDASPPRAGGRNSSQHHVGNLTSNVVHRRNSAGDGVAPGRVAGGGVTTTHRIREGSTGSGRLSRSDYDAGRKSMGDESMDDTPISVLKERANREAERNARREASQPHVPRLALGEITAKRDRQHDAASYKAARGSGGDGAGEDAALDTPATPGSVLSDVTVSPMTDSGTPVIHAGGRSGRSARSHNSDHPPHSKADDARVDPTSGTSAAGGKKHKNDSLDGTYDSRGTSAAREETGNTATKLSPVRQSVTNATGGSNNRNKASNAPSAPATETNTAAPSGSAVRPSKAKGDVSPAGSPAGTTAPPTKTGTGATGGAGAPANTASASQRQTNNTSNGNTATGKNLSSSAKPPPPPIATTSKEKAKCCVVM